MMHLFIIVGAAAYVVFIYILWRRPAVRPMPLYKLQHILVYESFERAWMTRVILYGNKHPPPTDEIDRIMVIALPAYRVMIATVDRRLHWHQLLIAKSRAHGWKTHWARCDD